MKKSIEKLIEEWGEVEAKALETSKLEYEKKNDWLHAFHYGRACMALAIQEDLKNILKVNAGS